MPKIGITPEMAHERLKHLVIIKHLTELAIEALLPHIPEDHQARHVMANAHLVPISVPTVEYVYSQIIPDNPERVRGNFKAIMSEIEGLFGNFVAGAAVGHMASESDQEEGNGASCPQQ